MPEGSNRKEVSQDQVIAFLSNLKREYQDVLKNLQEQNDILEARINQQIKSLENNPNNKLLAALFYSKASNHKIHLQEEILKIKDLNSDTQYIPLKTASASSSVSGQQTSDNEKPYDKNQNFPQSGKRISWKKSAIIGTSCSIAACITVGITVWQFTNIFQSNFVQAMTSLLTAALVFSVFNMVIIHDFNKGTDRIDPPKAQLDQTITATPHNQQEKIL